VATYAWDDCSATAGPTAVTTEAPAGSEPTPAKKPESPPDDMEPPVVPPGVGTEPPPVNPAPTDEPPPLNPGATPPPVTDPGPLGEPEIPSPAVPPAGTTPGVGDDRTDLRALPTRANSGLLVVAVPYDAKVFINDFETKAKGSHRQYVSYGLEPGLAYKYEIRAEVVRDGRLVTDQRTVVLTAGDRETVAFGFNPRPVEGLAQR
jgi:uncharacterized protein (TIGR03000 family)